MRLYTMTAAATLAIALSGIGFTQTNVQDNQDAQKQLKQDHKADKTQAKADKDEQKALKTKQAKKAAKAQDKANTQAEKAAVPPQ